MYISDSWRANGPSLWRVSKIFGPDRLVNMTHHTDVQSVWLRTLWRPKSYFITLQRAINPSLWRVSKILGPGRLVNMRHTAPTYRVLGRVPSGGRRQIPKPSGGYGIVLSGGCPKRGDLTVRSKAQPPYRHQVGLDGEPPQYTDWKTRLLYAHQYNMFVGT